MSPDKNISIVGVCGAGIMGTGISQVLASTVAQVLLFDSAKGLATSSTSKIEDRLESDVAKGRRTAEEASRILASISVVDRISEMAAADVVVEAVTENLAIKQQLFRDLEGECSSEAILVTNTSTLSPTEIGSVLADPGRTAGVHFFNPATRMPLVELIPGARTRVNTTNSLKGLLTAAGKTVVLVRESPGGIVSRLQLLVRNEAVRLIAEGVASVEDVDTAMRLGAGWPMGPLELIDLVGVDLHVNNSDSLVRELGSNRYAPHPYLRKLLRAGLLGQKTGEGFYRYPRASDRSDSSL